MMSCHPGATAAAERVRIAREPRKRRWDRVPDLSGAPDELLLAPSELTALSGIAEVTWRLWRRQGRGPTWVVIEGMPRLKLGEYRRWLNARSQPSN